MIIVENNVNRNAEKLNIKDSNLDNPQKGFKYKLWRKRDLIKSERLVLFFWYSIGHVWPLLSGMGIGGWVQFPTPNPHFYFLIN